jgi:hypothetical protein
MAEALDHAVTVRDLLYVCAGFIGLIFFLWCSAALYLMRAATRERRPPRRTCETPSMEFRRIARLLNPIRGDRAVQGIAGRIE